jgi:hypothetical protein
MKRIPELESYSRPFTLDSSQTSWYLLKAVRDLMLLFRPSKTATLSEMATIPIFFRIRFQWEWGG